MEPAYPFRCPKALLSGAKQEHHMRVPTLGCSCLYKNSKSKKGHNYIKNFLRITTPAGKGYHFDSKHWSEFQVNIFSNDRDIIKC